MATRRESILDNIKTTLETISVAHGYYTNVDTVEDVIKDWDKVKINQLPWLGYSTDPREGTTFEQQPFKRLVCSFGIVIIGHVNAIPGAAKNAALSNLEADIIKSMYSDHTRGGFAIDSTINDSLTDEGDDHLYVNKPTGTIVQTWTIRYFVATDDLE